MAVVPTKDQITEKLTQVIDPELRRSIVELGMVRSIDIRDDHVGAFFCKQESGFPAHTARPANDEKDLPAELGFRRHALQLRLFQRPVFDAEGLRPRKGDIVVELAELLGLF